MTQVSEVGRVELQRRRAENQGYQRLVKPVIDVTGAVLLLVAMLPLLLGIALVIRLHLGSPVLLRQRRVGKDGVPFDMLKFRTMRQDRRQWSGPFDGPDRRRTHKTVDDPRHTPIGRVLRALSLDELPQLWNVVGGDMSLVGPRPELVEIVARYEPWQHARHRVKPGLTGLWQVTERSSGNGLMHEHTETDLHYIEQASLATDVRILLRTVPVLLLRRGL